MAFTTDLTTLYNAPGTVRTINDIEPNDKLLKLEEVMELLTCRKNCVYNMVNAGTFPTPIKIGPKLARWSLKEINNWLDEQKQNKNSK